MRDPPTALLRVDLTAGTVEREPVPERWLRRYVGGKGLGARYLYEELPPGTDPLGPDNCLLFVVGPLTGLLPGDPRFAVVTRSPLTGTFLDSYSGGGFGAGLVGALEGVTGVLVTGRAEAPTVLELESGDGRLRPAPELWGADVVETCEALDGRVACVGPAGEQGVRYATVASDGGDHHAGRGGAGAVMGAKRLKSVVARGRSPEPGPALDDLGERYRRALRDGAGADGAPGRRVLVEELAVGLVELVEVVDVVEEHGRFEHVVQREPLGLEYRRDVLETLPGLLGDRFVVEQLAVDRER